MSDSKIRQAFEYSNPFSSRHETHKDFKKLTGTQKFGTVAVCIIVATISAIATAILLGVPALFITTAVCRALVGRFTQININAKKTIESNTPPAPAPPAPSAPPTPPASTNSSEPSTPADTFITDEPPVPSTEEEPSTPPVPSTEEESSTPPAPSTTDTSVPADTLALTQAPINPYPELATIPSVSPRPTLHVEVAAVVQERAFPSIFESESERSSIQGLTFENHIPFASQNALLEHLMELRLFGPQPRLIRCENIEEFDHLNYTLTNIDDTSFNAPINGFTITFNIENSTVCFFKNPKDNKYYLKVFSSISYLNVTSHFEETFEVEKPYFKELKKMDPNKLLFELIKTSHKFTDSIDLQGLSSNDPSLPTGREIYETLVECVRKIQNEPKPVAETPPSIPLELAMSSSFWRSLVIIPLFPPDESLLQARQRLGLEGTELNICNVTQNLINQHENGPHKSNIAFNNGVMEISDEITTEQTLRTFCHLLAETYGSDLSKLVVDHLKLVDLPSLTWKDVQAALISIATNVRAEDLKRLFNQIKGNPEDNNFKDTPLRCYETVLTERDIDNLKAYEKFEDLPKKMLDVLLRPFRSIVINGALISTYEGLADIVTKNHQTTLLHFDPVVSDISILKSLESYKKTSVDRIQEFPQVTISEFCAKEITYQEVKRGMIVSIPVLDGNAISSKHYQVFDSHGFADGIVFNLMTPLNKQQSLKDPNGVDEIHLNFRGSAFTTDQLASGATWVRNTDFWGIGKTTFDRYKKNVLSLVTNYLKTTPVDHKINLNISGHSLAGADVQRTVVAICKQIEQAPKILECMKEIDTCIEILNRVPDSHDEKEQTPITFINESRQLLNLLESQIKKSDPTDRSFIGHNLYDSLTDLRKEVDTILKASNVDVNALKAKMTQLMKHVAITDLKVNLPLWRKISAINVTSHNAPRPELALDDEFTATFAELDMNPDAPMVNMTHVRISDLDFEDIVQKLGDTLIGAKIQSTKLQNTIVQVNIDHSYGKSGIKDRHSFHAFCKPIDEIKSSIEIINNRNAVNKILLNRHYWSDEEKGLITLAFASVGWYIGHIARIGQNFVHGAIYYFGIVPIFNAVRYFIESRGKKDE